MLLQPTFMFFKHSTALILRVILKTTQCFIKPQISPIEEVNNQQGISISASYICYICSVNKKMQMCFHANVTFLLVKAEWKKVSASVGFIINFMASRSWAEGKLKSFVPKLLRKKYKIYFYLASWKFLVSAGRLHSDGAEIFSRTKKK